MWNGSPLMLRILSLLPASTEIVYLLGLEKNLVGVSHECDYPLQVQNKPKVTFSVISNSMTSKEINNRVKRIGHRGPGVFHIYESKLKELKPNLILTQELCEVCAVGFDEVKKAARILDGDTKIISLEPESVEDVLENIKLVGQVTGYRLQAENAVKKLKRRISNVKYQIFNTQSKPKVLVIEWLDPVMVAGHWIPQMVEIAGGINLISKAKEKSKIVTLDQILTSKPDILIISPCGFDIKRTIKEKKLIEKIIKNLGDVKVYLIDGNSYMTRPGPRIVDGIEILYDILKDYASY